MFHQGASLDVLVFSRGHPKESLDVLVFSRGHPKDTPPFEAELCRAGLVLRVIRK